MTHILDFDISQLQHWLSKNKQPSFRASQIIDWIYDKRAKSFDEMNNLPKKLREQLTSEFQIWTTSIIRHQQADDGTEKLLLELNDGEQTECVLLRDKIRRSICISSQVGCSMGCVFCASGLDGIVRNLTRGEIIEQMLQLQLLLNNDERLSHIVVMGMGEPLSNLTNVLAGLEMATDDNGLGISARRITISTVGIPEGINNLAELNSRYNLAVSLHAPYDELRDTIVPSNRKLGIDKLLQAADHYFDVSGRKLTYEYVLIAGINDHPDHARQLVKLLCGRNALLNVIPFNPVEGLPYQRPDAINIQKFRHILETGGLNVQLRKRKGGKINASCGQLRRSCNSIPQGNPNKQ